MDDLPELLVWEILRRIEKTADRNSVSLACKRFYSHDNEQRHVLRISCGLYPPNNALTTLCTRFPNLTKVEISCAGWMMKFGEQLDDHGLFVLSNNCPSLVDLTLSYCTSITDAGLCHVASCTNLSALKLNFMPRITGCGLLTIAVDCKKLSSLCLIHCLNVRSDWLWYLGRVDRIEELSIKNCRGIKETDLIKLGLGWRKLKRLGLEFNYHSSVDAYDNREKQFVICENLVELNLVNCIVSKGRGLSFVLQKCPRLDKINLEFCIGVRDSTVMDLVQNSRYLRSISLCISPHNNTLMLTDKSLKAIAENCLVLESFKLSYPDGESSLIQSFTLDGLLTLVRLCPIRELSLSHMYFFNDVGMEALCSAKNLETLEIIYCQEVSDEGLHLVSQFPRLSALRLVKCMGVTDDGLKPLLGSNKLESLAVEDCPLISEACAEQAARSLTFRFDMSWMC